MNDGRIAITLNYNGKFREKYKLLYGNKQKLNNLIYNNILTKNIAGKELEFLKGGKYLIGEKIDEFGTVFKAKNLITDEIVSIKRIDKCLMPNSIFNSIILNSLITISQKTKNFVKYKEHFETQYCYYIVQNVYDDNLEHIMKINKKFTPNLIHKIFTQLNLTFIDLLSNFTFIVVRPSNILIKYCNPEKSYVQITKLENEYIIKVQLSCTDNSDYIIEHYGCYDICSDKCKMLETTTTKKTTIPVVTTTKKGALYEYKFYKDVCSDKFVKYVCPTDYSLVGNKCVKNGSIVDSKPATETVEKVPVRDEKPAKAVVTPNDSKTNASCTTQEQPSTIDATANTKTTDEVLLKTQNVTADKVTITDRKGAVGTVTTLKSDYISVQNYDVITATKIEHAQEQWVYVSTLTSQKSNLAFSNDTEKLILVDS